MSVLDKLDAATPFRREVSIYLDGAAQAEHDRLLAQLEDAAAQDERDGSLADPTPNVRGIVEAVDELRTRMQDSEVIFVFERWDWTELVRQQADHPPRDGNLIDRVRGYNVETFSPILIRESCLGVRDPGDEASTEVPAERWERLLPTLNLNQVMTLDRVARQVNEGDSQVPPSVRFLLASQDSEANSAQPGPGTSPRAASKAGSRRTSPKSSGTRKATSTRARSSGT